MKNETKPKLKRTKRNIIVHAPDGGYVVKSVTAYDYAETVAGRRIFIARRPEFKYWTVSDFETGYGIENGFDKQKCLEGAIHKLTKYMSQVDDVVRLAKRNCPEIEFPVNR